MQSLLEGPRGRKTMLLLYLKTLLQLTSKELAPASTSKPSCCQYLITMLLLLYQLLVPQDLATAPVLPSLLSR
jgi:hypothetical protein